MTTYATLSDTTSNVVVVKLQYKLSTEDYWPGAADGKFNAALVAAIDKALADLETAQTEESEDPEMDPTIDPGKIDGSDGGGKQGFEGVDESTGDTVTSAAALAETTDMTNGCTNRTSLTEKFVALRNATPVAESLEITDAGLQLLINAYAAFKQIDIACRTAPTTVPVEVDAASGGVGKWLTNNWKLLAGGVVVGLGAAYLLRKKG